MSMRCLSDSFHWSRKIEMCCKYKL